jgi:hypothetical protein
MVIDLNAPKSLVMAIVTVIFKRPTGMIVADEASVFVSVLYQIVDSLRSVNSRNVLLGLIDGNALLLIVVIYRIVIKAIVVALLLGIEIEVADLHIEILQGGLLGKLLYSIFRAGDGYKILVVKLGMSLEKLMVSNGQKAISLLLVKSFQLLGSVVPIRQSAVAMHISLMELFCGIK